MTADTGKGVIVNAALSASTWVLPLVLSFVATPILLSAFGHEAYGIYAVVMGFVGYSFTFGIGKAAAKYVAEYRAAGANDLASESLSATLWFSLLVGSAGAVSIAAVAGHFVENVLLIPAADADEATRGLIVAAGIILFTMLSQVWSFTLQGLHRFDRYAAVTAGGSVVLNVGAIGLAWGGFGVVAVLLWNLISTILVGTAFLAAVRLSDDRIRITLNIRRSVRNAVFNYGGAIILTQVFGNLLLLIERAWITRNLGVEALTFYVVPMTLALFLHAFIGSIVIVLFPMVNERLAAPERVLKIYRVSTKFVLALAVYAVPTSIVFGEHILTAWVGGAIAERSAGLLTIHICTFGLLASATVAWHVAESFGRPGTNVIFSLSWLAVGTALMFLLGRSYALEGIAVARLIGCLGVIPLSIFVESRVLGSFSAAYWLHVILRLFAAVGACFALQVLLAAWIDGISAVLVGALAGGAAYVLTLIAFRYFEAAELDWFRRSFKNSTPLLP